MSSRNIPAEEHEKHQGKQNNDLNQWPLHISHVQFKTDGDKIKENIVQNQTHSVKRHTICTL